MNTLQLQLEQEQDQQERDSWSIGALGRFM
jgi:hypothetical protein